MDDEKALNAIASILNSNELRLCKSDHVILEQAFNHIKGRLSSDQPVEPDTESEE